MRYSADELYYENVVVLGYRALFTNERIRRDTVPVGWYLYEVRHDDECQGIPCEIARGILVNFWGSLLMRDKLSEVEKMAIFVSVRKTGLMTQQGIVC